MTVIIPSSVPTDVSLEGRYIIQYLRDSAVSGTITCTTNHSLTTSAGFVSLHVKEGTNGMGLAVDIAGISGGRDTQSHADIFNAFLRVETQLHELIYAGPQVSFNIKRGKRVAKYATQTHHDHVHIAVAKGTLIKWPTPTQKEDIMAGKFVVMPKNPVPDDKGRWPHYAVDEFGQVYNRNIPDGAGIRGLKERNITPTAKVTGVLNDPREGSKSIILFTDSDSTYTIGPND